MASRNLARTVVEGGHPNWYKHDVAFLRRKERQRERRFCKKLLADPELWDEQPPLLTEKSGWWDNKHDHYAASVDKWLQAQSGRRWDEILSELTNTYDTRKTRNYILLERICGMVCLIAHSNGETCWHRFMVEDGILKTNRSHWRVRWWREKRLVSDEQLRDWLGNRTITIKDGHVHWMILSPGTHEMCFDMFSRWNAVLQRWQARHAETHEPNMTSGFQLSKRLNAQELELYNKLTPRQKRMCHRHK